MEWLDITSWVLLSLGSFFCVVGAIGLLRFPDFYTRMHAAGVTDTLGAGLILVGLMFLSVNWLITVKLFLILMFLVLSSATSTHALAKSAITKGLEPLLTKNGENRDSAD